MTFLILCILSNVAIFLSFRSFSRFDINTFQAIVFNYIVCVLTGILFHGLGQLSAVEFKSTWFQIALLLGVIFIITFYLMAITTQKISVTLASVASKMSLAIPVLFSLFILKTQSKPYDYINYIGIVLAIAAILLSSLKKDQEKMVKKKRLYLLALPLAVFLFGGAIDTLINYTNYKYLTAQQEAIFPILIFAAAATIGCTLLLVKRNTIELKSIIGGLYLGIPNYFSLYFIIKTLSAFNNDGAIVFPALNIGIVLLSSFFAVLIFKERLLKVNKIGILLAILAIILISYQEIWDTMNE